MIRRVIYCYIAFYEPFINYIILQIIILMLMNVLMIIYTGNKPLNNRFMNRHELCNEFFVCIITMHIILFTDYIPDEEIQYLMGW